MVEEKQQADRSDSKTGKPPDSPPVDMSASPEKEEVKIPEMDVPQSESASGEQSEAQVQVKDIQQEVSEKESPDSAGETAEAKIMETPERDSTLAPDNAETTPAMEDQPLVEKPSFKQLKPEDKEKVRNINMLLDVSLPVS
ncbi:MAG: hypothetical protein DRP26_07580, partial [Candidatus Zixiibacteriota bacterium]